MFFLLLEGILGTTSAFHWPLPDQVSSIAVVRQNERIALYANDDFLSSFYVPGKGVELEKDFAIGAGEGGYERFTGQISRLVVSTVANIDFNGLESATITPTVAALDQYPSFPEAPLVTTSTSRSTTQSTIQSEFTTSSQDLQTSSRPTTSQSTTSQSTTTTSKSSVQSQSTTVSSNFQTSSRSSISSTAPIQSQSATASNFSKQASRSSMTSMPTFEKQDSNSPDPEDSDFPIIPVVGALLGVALILGVIVAVVLWRKKKKSRPTIEEESDGTMMTDPNYGSTSFAID